MSGIPGAPTPMDVDTDLSLLGPSDDITSPSASGSSSDPASSLRAAALLTLKYKRRKPNVETSSSVLSLRPVPLDNSPQLDYGQDEPSPPRSGPVPTPTTTSTPPQPTSALMDDKDSQVREEGEISDSEDSQPNLKDPTPPQEFVSVKTSSIEKRVSPDTTAPIRFAPSGNVTPTLSSAQAQGLAAEVPQVHSSASTSGPSTSALSSARDILVVETREYVLDSEHVRPDLSSLCILPFTTDVVLTSPPLCSDTSPI